MSRISQIDQQKYPILLSNISQEDIHPSPTVFEETSGVSVAKSWVLSHQQVAEKKW